MSYKSKPDLNQKKKFQSYYIKKLQTQSSVERIDNKTLSQTSDILQKQIQKMQQSLYERNSIYSRTLKRKNQIDQEEEKLRSQLKSRLQQKMRKSQQNLLSHRQKSNSSLSSRLKAQAKKIQEIKRLQKTFYNETYQKSKQMRTKTQRFFKDLSDKKKVTSPNITFNNSQMKYYRKKQPLFQPLSNKKMKINSHRDSLNDSLDVNPEKTHFALAKILTTRQTIQSKQKKKLDLQKAKQDSFLQEYASKLQSIQVARKRSHVQKKIPQTTFSKLVLKQNYDERIQQRQRFSKSFVNPTVGMKGLFSENYQKKLKQKKERISFFLSQSLAQGDLIMKGQMKDKNKLKLSKLIRQTQNQLARKQNFRYMEKYLNKKF